MFTLPENLILDILKFLWPLWLVLGSFLFLKIFFGSVLPRLIRRHKTRRNFEKGKLWRSDQDLLRYLKALTPREFEEYVAELFNRLGYKAKAVGGSDDGGIDVVAEKDGVKHYIQCKKFNNWEVRVGDIRAFYGVIAGKLSEGKAYFVTTNKFTLDSEKFAEDKPIELVDGFRLVKYIRMAEKEDAKRKKSAR